MALTWSYAEPQVLYTHTHKDTMRKFTMLCVLFIWLWFYSYGWAISKAGFQAHKHITNENKQSMHQYFSLKTWHLYSMFKHCHSYNNPIRKECIIHYSRIAGRRLRRRETSSDKANWWVQGRSEIQSRDVLIRSKVCFFPLAESLFCPIFSGTLPHVAVPCLFSVAAFTIPLLKLMPHMRIIALWRPSPDLDPSTSECWL